MRTRRRRRWPFDRRKWKTVSCSCHGGIRDNGYGEPTECTYCGGGAVYFVHRKTGTCAQYPGGPLLGAHEPKRKRSVRHAA